MSDIHIVTVATESKYYFPYLVESCKRNGRELEVLAFGEKWRGFNMKFNLMINYLKTLPENDIVCFVDGYDVLCVRNLQELKSEFIRLKNKHNCKIIVGEDKQQNEFCSFVSSIAYGSTGININSGTYIGYVKEILYILLLMHEKYPKDTHDDQIILTEYYKNNPTSIYVDTYNEIFYTKTMIFQEINNDIIHENGILINGENPFFIHAPHGFFDKLIISLNYKYDNSIKNNLIIDFFTIKIWNCVLTKYIYIFLLLSVLLIIIYFVYFSNISNKILKLSKTIRKK